MAIFGRPFTPTGLHPKAQGWPGPAYPGSPPRRAPTPTGLHPVPGYVTSRIMPQSLISLLVHLVFSTKERVPYLSDADARVELHNYLGGIINKNGQSLTIGGVADHVHILFAMSKTIAIADIVRDVKRASSLWIKGLGDGFRDFSWQNGYGAFSVGQTEIELVEKYIREQEEHHRVRGFQEEYSIRFHMMSATSGIEWDPGTGCNPRWGWDVGGRYQGRPFLGQPFAIR